MRLLLDTHLLLWVLFDQDRVSARAREYLAEPEAQPIFSVISIWEIAIKASAGKLKVDATISRATLLKDGFEELPVFGAHAETVANLPRLHADPFDRMLIAQAMSEKMQLLTVDAKLKPYSELVVMV
jgi:PIN domain nuclease of toxin-antitoxin system